MNIIIGLIGAKGAGKTTAFEAMAQVTNVAEITLAKKLKDVCSEIFEIPRDHFDSHDFKEKVLDPPIYLDSYKIQDCYTAFDLNPKGGNDGRITDHTRPHVGKILTTPREVAQYVGTEVLRTLEPDVHCINAVKGVDGSIGVVTDIRFPDEFEFFAKNYPNFIPVYIKNTGAEIAASGDTHVSEAYLRVLADKAEVQWENNGPIRDFQEQVRGFIDSVGNRNV